MKRVILRVGLLVCCIASGYVLGYLRLPHIENKAAFWVGFVACFVVLMVLHLGRRIWLNRSLLKMTDDDDTRQIERKYSRLQRVFIILMTSLIIISISLISSTRRDLKEAMDEHDQSRKRFENVTDSLRKITNASLLGNLLNAVDLELRTSDTLSDELIGRIAAMSSTFQPYHLIENGQISDHLLSPERGQLLLSLVNMRLDSISFRKIKQTTTFAYADLRKCSIPNMDLTGIDIHHADLSSGNFTKTLFDSSNLEWVTARGAKLDSTSLSYCRMRRINCSWAMLNGAILKRSDVKGASMQNVQLNRACTHNSIFHWTDLSGSLFKSADIRYTDFARTNLDRVDFSNANMVDARLAKATLRQANLTNAILDSMEVHDGWSRQIEKWKVFGRASINANYRTDTLSLGEQGFQYYLYKRN